ncbi:aggregation-promoting factor C-terminal-like domain-containing protein [Plantactinospora endophytica]|uniref:Lytic transglycosylase domain-containing protein n=1 Tax=Plantactinospora endophytica TaxID=673535 RepID=A0ABQ4DTH6_9ACTN|nr:lytic transglycosylase domain-containing protein [Plantactinospora endophytica]GIG85755.1 hypothetical protein Pen02_06910 [Plantactinospora endophytica]
MSRLWSRFGVRGVAMALLLGGVGGGYYLGEDREAQQHSIEAESAFDAQQAEWDLLRERHAAHILATVDQRAAEAEAARKAAEVAKAAADRAKKADQAASRKREREKQEKEEAETATKPYTGPIPASCNEYSGNRKIGCALLLEEGFKLAEMPCLDKLWNKESGWNHKAENRSSGAYGIPQALPGTKMASAGSDWKTSPATQIEWGLGYIKGRYGTPCDAWAHSQDVGWY